MSKCCLATLLDSLSEGLAQSGSFEGAQRAMAYPVIYLQSLAPAKPAPGAPCNGCGVCCTWQPCPLGMLVSGRRQGACTALRWHDGEQRYHCAMVADPQAVWPRLPGALQALFKRLALRWIAGGAGCDCDLEVAPDAAPPPGSGHG